MHRLAIVLISSRSMLLVVNLSARSARPIPAPTVILCCLAPDVCGGPPDAESENFPYKINTKNWLRGR